MIQIGDFISVPAWKTFGCVIGLAPAHYGSDDAQRVLLQEDPDQPARDARWYNLEPGQYEMDSDYAAS